MELCEVFPVAQAAQVGRNTSSASQKGAGCRAGSDAKPSHTVKQLNDDALARGWQVSFILWLEAARRKHLLGLGNAHNATEAVGGVCLVQQFNASQQSKPKQPLAHSAHIPTPNRGENQKEGEKIIN